MRRAVIAGAALIAGLGGTLGIVGTFAGFTDSESNTESTVTAGTVVLAGHGTPVSLAYPDLRDGVARTVELPVENRGTVPVRAELLLPSGPTETSCTFDGLRWADGPSAGALTVQVGQAGPVAYCSMLDGGPRVLAATVAPGATVHVPITVTASGLPDRTRTERAPVVLRGVGGFTDHIPGTIEISAGGPPGALAAPVAEPEPTLTTEAATGADVPDGGAPSATCDAEPAEGAPDCPGAPGGPASTGPTPTSPTATGTTPTGTTPADPTPADLTPTDPTATSPTPADPTPSSPAPTPSGTAETSTATASSTPDEPRPAKPPEADTSEPVDAAEATATEPAPGTETATTEPPAPDPTLITATPPTAESDG